MKIHARKFIWRGADEKSGGQRYYRHARQKQTNALC
jgi:hypothetical protein